MSEITKELSFFRIPCYFGNCGRDEELKKKLLETIRNQGKAAAIELCEKLAPSMKLFCPPVIDQISK